ncbi:hypothetical protein [Portibacter lacus]|uniref:Uncharacterized protein n=1 Tax=Portibacter lacus TaxID=1099794 RepID=A0AA37SRF6_9BACT|nr:hypothetical protein [Portibacter lacus]GLR18812.1 hypothetical protein GCM10007940_34280 [Portibacter lacus]
MKLTNTLVLLLFCISLSAQNVGVNIAIPESTMDIRSKSISEPSQLNISNQDRSRYVRFFSGSETYPDPSMSWNPGHSLLFATYDDANFIFTEYMRIDSLGRVGIGVTDPDAKLEVDGQIKIMGGSPGADKVLISDADGLASWGASPPPPATTYSVGDFAQGGVVF